MAISSLDRPHPGPPAAWRQYAACLGVDPELFFPIGSTGPAEVQLEFAKAICASCPVRAACLAWALSTGTDHGVWGGLSEDERRSLKRKVRRARSTAKQTRREEVRLDAS